MTAGAEVAAVAAVVVADAVVAVDPRMTRGSAGA